MKGFFTCLNSILIQQILQWCGLTLHDVDATPENLMQGTSWGISHPEPLGLGGSRGIRPHRRRCIHGWSDTADHLPGSHHDGGAEASLQPSQSLQLLLM